MIDNSVRRWESVAYVTLRKDVRQWGLEKMEDLRMVYESRALSDTQVPVLLRSLAYIKICLMGSRALIGSQSRLSCRSDVDLRTLSSRGL